MEILARGRMTEAYYELIRKSSEYPDSSVLLYRKAVILYLMNRDAEAREILVKLRREKAFEEKVAELYLRYRLRIVGEHRESDIPADLLPEVLFNAAKLKNAEKRSENPGGKADTGADGASGPLRNRRRTFQRCAEIFHFRSEGG